MPTAGDDKVGDTESLDRMRRDLAALLGDAGTGELTSAEFYERLTQIHVRHLGDDANTAGNETRRVEALRAFEGLAREAPSRHHELERLAQALGIPPT